MKKLIIASIIGMTFFQSCTKENNIVPLDDAANKTSLERKIVANPNETPPIYIPEYEKAVR